MVNWKNDRVFISKDQTNHGFLWFYADVKITTNFEGTFLELDIVKEETVVNFHLKSIASK